MGILEEKELVIPVTGVGWGLSDKEISHGKTQRWECGDTS